MGFHPSIHIGAAKQTKSSKRKNSDVFNEEIGRTTEAEAYF